MKRNPHKCKTVFPYIFLIFPYIFPYMFFLIFLLKSYLFTYVVAFSTFVVDFDISDKMYGSCGRFDICGNFYIWWSNRRPRAVWRMMWRNNYNWISISCITMSPALLWVPCSFYWGSYLVTISSHRESDRCWRYGWLSAWQVRRLLLLGQKSSHVGLR